MFFSKKVNVWLWLFGRIAIVIVIIAFLFFFQVFDFFCQTSVPRFSDGDLDPTANVIVTLNDNICHLSGCIEIKGPTETMKYGAAIGKGIKPCPVCIYEDDE